jgi:hypothetical protein
MLSQSSVLAEQCEQPTIHLRALSSPTAASPAMAGFPHSGQVFKGSIHLSERFSQVVMQFSERF